MCFRQNALTFRDEYPGDNDLARRHRKGSSGEIELAGVSVARMRRYGIELATMVHEGFHSHRDGPYV